MTALKITSPNLTNMPSNLERFRKDLSSLLADGDLLFLGMQKECSPKRFAEAMRKVYKNEAEKMFEGIPLFRDSYQTWYSEAKVLIKQLLPERLSDFVSHYERPKSRKSVTLDGYRIEDYLQGLTVTRGVQKQLIVRPDVAIPHFRQQLAILKSLEKRFQSSLFDIRQLVQADLFDSDLDAAEELAKKKFTRASGAMAGVVLERHLAQVCGNHAVKVAKKSPSISDLNDALKAADIVDVPQWRYIQLLADIRNLCDHSKAKEPTAEQSSDLISGVRKLIKTLF